jgi:hypothetical protein
MPFSADKKRDYQRSYMQKYRKQACVSGTIVAWDGEGVTDPGGRHRYTLLANSEGASHEAGAGESIGTKEALDFLLSQRGSGNALHIIFVGSYDVAMILHELSCMKKVLWMREKGRNLGPYSGKQIIEFIYRNETQKGITVSLGGVWYEIFYRPRKVFRIRRYNDNRFYVKDAKGKSIVNGITMTIWDVFGFSQSSFVAALRKYKIRDEAFLAEMQTMKDARSTFDESRRESIRKYCVDECRALRDLYRKQLENFAAADLVPSQHHGPGALASKLLKRHGLTRHIALEAPELRTDIARAFFGGRIELCKVGHFGTVHSADIVSAYPAAATELPSLIGEWVRGTNVQAFGVFHLEYEFPLGFPWYPLPYRDRRRVIRFADAGRGWYWRPEVLAALEWVKLHGGWIHVIEGWELRPDEPTAQPFGMIPELFAQRQKWKDEGNGAEGALKLALNSLYGQTARQIGGSLEKLPPFFSLVWAGTITSATRARLVMATMCEPDKVIAFATDGIYSVEPLAAMDGLPMKPSLGEWECSTPYDQGVFVQAGVYWLAKQAGSGLEWLPKFRGFDRKGMETPDRVLDAWSKGETKLAIPTTRFVTYGSALCSRAQWLQRARWFTDDRDLSLTGNSAKRYGVDSLRGGVHNLQPRRNDWYQGTGEDSIPYDSFTVQDSDRSADTIVEDIEDSTFT